METQNQKRKGYISWDEYFMGVAILSGMRSKDPNSQVGACIVSKDNKILSMGYNGFPMGCSDDEFPWAREGEPLDTKYLYVTHSELNAILNYRGGSLEGAKLYVSLFPCNECAKAIIQSGGHSVCDRVQTYARRCRRALLPLQPYRQGDFLHGINPPVPYGNRSWKRKKFIPSGLTQKEISHRIMCRKSGEENST